MYGEKKKWQEEFFFSFFYSKDRVSYYLSAKIKNKYRMNEWDWWIGLDVMARMIHHYYEIKSIKSSIKGMNEKPKKKKKNDRYIAREKKMRIINVHHSHFNRTIFFHFSYEKKSVQSLFDVNFFSVFVFVFVFVFFFFLSSSKNWKSCSSYVVANWCLENFIDLLNIIIIIESNQINITKKSIDDDEIRWI